MRQILPLAFILSLTIAFTGAVMLLKNGEFETTPLLLLVIGLAGAVGMGFRVGGLGGMDEREVSAKIRARAQLNLEQARSGAPKHD
ncbi:MAG: hypothetical protein EXS08_17065 [Planctomycetes bacterium]|nr:hypothetical protein [Planctomycetota bacterium]